MASFLGSAYWNFDPLQPGVAYLCSMKTSENLKFFLMFLGSIDK